MKVLVTGASGWLGRYLVPALRVAGHDPIGFDVVPGAETLVLGSVADRAAVDRVFADHAFGGVIHAGGLHKPDIARHPTQAFIDVNVTGTRNLLAAATAAGVSSFVFTSTTSLMITAAIRAEAAPVAAWLEEATGPLAPRNIYGVTKLAAEGLCRIARLEDGLPVVVLRTGRFFPEDDDTHRGLGGPNLKANEFLGRRLTVEDTAAAHVAALAAAPRLGFDCFVVAAPTPFVRDDVAALRQDARWLIDRHFPDAAMLYARAGWQLPASIGRVYDPGRAERVMGFRCATDFGAVLAALRDGAPLPFAHDPHYVSPMLAAGPPAARG